MTPEDDYAGQLLQELRGEDSARLKTAVNFGVTKTPATYAQQLKTAKLTGMPVQALDDAEVQRILEPLSRKSTIPLDTLPETAPRTSAWLSTHPDNAALGWSSVGQLQTAEQQHQELFAAERQRVDEENRRRGVSGLGGLGRSVLQGGANIGALPYDLTSSALAGLEWAGVLSPTARQATKDFLFSDTSPLNAVAPNPYKMAHDSAEYWQSTGRATESLLLTDPKTGEQVMNWGAINPFSLHGLENITQTVAQEAIPTVIQFGVAAMFPPAALGEAALHGPKAARLAKTFWRFATSASAGLEVARTVQGQYNNGIKDLEARGYTKEQAEVEAAPGAYLAGAFSFLAGAPMEASVMEGLAERAMRAPGGPGLVKLVQQSLKSAAVTAGKEGLQEVMNGLGEDAAEWMTYNPNKTAKEFAANAVMNFVGGAAMGGLLGGVSGGQMHMRYAKERAFVEGLHAGLSQSELAKVAPDKFQEYVAQLTENGPLQNLTIGADAWTTYHQSIGEDPRAKALELGVDGADYDIATQAGGDLVLPTAAVATHIAGTEHFEPLFKSMSPALGAPTFGEMKAGQANQEGTEALTKLIETQPESEDRDAIRGLIAAQLHEASTALTPTQATSVADLYARFVVALATQTQQTPMAVFEKNRLQIENAVKMKAQEVANEPASSRGYDGAPGAGGVQAEEAGGGVQGVPGRSEQVRDGLLQGQLAPAPAGFEFAAGAKPPARVWHGTTGQGFDTLKAEGLEPNQEGGLPGLNTTAGPHVAEGYAKDRATGEVTGRVFKVSVDPNAKLIDFSTEKSYTPDELAKLGVANVRGPLTGAQLWDMLRHQLGSSEAAVDHLKAYGFDGAYQNHGGEDAWAYWRDASLLRSAPTSMQQAQAEYALQGSRRDDLGFLKLAQSVDGPTGGVSELHQEGGRGFLRFGPAGEDGSRTFDLGLLKAENKSTVLHEFGHLYLEMMGDAVLLEKASDSLKADYQKVLDWFGVTERSQITREMHEQFADAHLQYLLEGKAPSPELVSPFRRFSKWLTKIGNQLLGVDVPMTDEIRGVFDRLYASEAEIEATKQMLGPELMTTPEQAGLSQAEFDLLQRHRADAIEEAKEKLLRRMMREQERERKQEWREERDRYKQQALQELGQRQDYKAQKALETGQLEDGTSIQGLDSENAALFLGYESGTQLDEALKGLEPIEKAANRFAKQQMAALHGDLLLDGVARRKAAVEALTGDKQGDLIAAELKVLRKLAEKEKPFVKLGATEQRALNDAEKAQAKEDAKAAKAEDRAAQREAAVTPKLSAFRAIAAAHIVHTPLFRVQPNVYLNAMRKHARTAYNAALRNDYAAAAQAHERQLMNHYLHIEAQRALDYQDQFRAWVKRNDSATVRGNIGRAGGTFLAQFDALRDRFGIERVTTTELDRKETLAEWAAGLEAQHEDTLISPQLADESFTKNYRELTLAEMQELHDALKNIKHLAYRETHMLLDGTRIDRKQALEEIVAAMAKNARAKARPELGADRVARKAYKHKITAMLEGADSSFVKVQLLANWIDGDNVNGPFHKYIWNRISQAQTLGYDLQLKMHSRLLRVMEEMPKDRRHSLSDPIEVPGFGTRTRAAVLTMLLYNGQETRRHKLLDGYLKPNAQGETLSEAAMLGAFAHLDAADVAMANEIWAVFDELRPQIQDLEQRLTGVRPEWEAARSFDIHDEQGNVIGHLNGGYFPLLADPYLTRELGKKQEGGTVSQLFGNGYARASTSKGHTKELTGATYPLLLDYTRALTANLANQIHDLAFREAVLDINRIFKNSNFIAAAKAHLGEAYEDQLMPWLVNIANNGNAGASEGMSFWNRVAIAARGNTAAAVIGFKYSSGIVQVMDVERLFRPGPGRVSPRHFSGAMMDFIAHPKATIKMVRELSGEMRHRPEHIDRDMAANLKRLQGDQSLLATWNRKGYVFLAGMDALVSIPAWLGSFRQALASGADEASAIRQADNTVTSRLMTGHAKDLPALMASKNHWWKLATMFMGDATNNYNMLRDAGHRIDGFKGVPTFTLSALMMMGAGVLADLVKGLGPDDDEDPGAWAMRKALLQPFQTMPIVRDGANALENVIAGKPFKDYRFSPALAILQKQIDLVPAAMRFSDGTDDWVDFAIHAGEAVGYFFGIAGTAQAAASTKYLKRYAEGEEEPAAPPVVAYNTVRGKKRSR